MKEFLLGKKWFGAMALAIYALAVSYWATGFSVNIIRQTMPQVEQELAAFLPVVIEKGEVVIPKDTIISKVYGQGNNARNIVLNTRVDELETSELNGKGVYLSRKYLYIVSDIKTEVHPVNKLPDMVIDAETLHDAAQIVQDKAGGYIFAGVFLFLLIFSAAAIGLYSLAMHWALSGMFNITFNQTLRINTLSYIVISALSFVGLNVSIILTFVILFMANYGVNKYLKLEKVKS